MSSIRDVAKRAGVAACTVSRVLNDTASVSPDTREKIEQAMKELNYIPNELARSMFKQRSGIIAMLVPSIKHPFFSSLADFIEKELYLRGYKLMLCSTSNSIERERDYLQMFKSNIVDGAIMAVTGLEKSEYTQFKKPMVMLDCKIDKKIPFVVSDHKEGGRLAAEEFIKNQCQCVLHLCAKIDDKEILSYESHAVLEKLLDNQGIRSRAQEIKWDNFDIKEYREIAELILQTYPEIDGVMAPDMVAAAFYEVGKKLRRKIPKDLCIIAYDGTYALDLIEAELTVVVQNLEKYSLEVVETILSMIENPGNTVKNKYIPVIIKKGQTS